MKTKLFLTSIILIVFVTVAGAQNRGNGNGRQNNQEFVDADKDGVCDNFQNRDTTQNNKQAYRRGNGNGQGNGYKQGRGKGRGNGQGKARGSNGRGNFTDANQNGICDNRE